MNEALYGLGIPTVGLSPGGEEFPCELHTWTLAPSSAMEEGTEKAPIQLVKGQSIGPCDN